VKTDERAKRTRTISGSAAFPAKYAHWVPMHGLFTRDNQKNSRTQSMNNSH